MKKKFVLFDFDGVIVDSFRTAYGVAHLKCPHLSEDDYRRKFEGNINDGDNLDAHTNECRLDLDFFEHYVPRIEKEATLIAPMKDVIESLAQKYTLVIISSTITVPIEKLLEKFNLRAYFTEVMGNDVHKSKVEKMKMVFEKYKTTAEDSIFITDTLGDMREAEKMKVGAIGVTWGFHTPETLEKGNVFRVVEKPEEIVPAVTDYFA